MKKIIYTFLFVFTLLLTISVVYAKEENKLYFTNSGDRLYYKTDLYDDKVFMKHLDMVPGSSYEDKLTIENHTNYDYKLYLKVKKRNQSTLAEELLENIEMTIILDGEVLYEGYANGEDYKKNGIDLQDSIYIGEYKSGNLGELLVKTKLKEEYSNTENLELSYIDWEFVAEYEELVIPINPDTGSHIDAFLKGWMISIPCILFIMVIYLFLIKRRKLVIKKL